MAAPEFQGAEEPGRGEIPGFFFVFATIRIYHCCSFPANPLADKREQMNRAFMQEAIRISIEMMRANQGGPFGAVVVRNDEIVGRGWNQVTSLNDPTAHAEVTAIRDACRRMDTFHLEDCEIYTSCEPCPMCLASIYWARLKKVYFGNTRHDAAAIGFDDDLIYSQLALPMASRQLAFEQCCREDALSAFKEWQQKPDKVLY